MNGSPEFLEYYLVEAAEYLDALDQITAGPVDRAPDINAMLASTRALRGSSTMASAAGIADIASELEALAGRLGDAAITWDANLAQLLRRTVAELRLLVRGVRVWGAREDALVAARLAELRKLGSPGSARPTPPSIDASTPVFVALQGAAIAAELEAFVGDQSNRRALDDAVARTRTLRGLAGIANYPPLSDVGDSVERVARRLVPDAPMSPVETEVFRAAAALFRVAAEHLRGGRHHVPAEASERLAAALSALDAPATATPPVVRIEQLFHADAGPHIVERAPAPPMTAEQRLHRDLVPRAEHLLRLVGDGRAARDPVTAARLRRELNEATRELETLAASYGAHEVSAFFAESRETRDPLAAVELDALESASRHLGTPFRALDDLERAIATVQRRRFLTPSDVPAVIDPQRPTARHTPTGADLKALLGTGIAGFRSLESEPLIPPADLDQVEIVPIDDLLFRGDAALERAIALRDAWHARGEAPDDTLQEIFDLLDLARSNAS